MLFHHLKPWSGRSLVPGDQRLLFRYFFFLIILGTGLLLLPVAWSGPERLSFVDALFTTVSAVCVTGLITVDTAQYSFFGQTVIMGLILSGGLGIITFATLYISLAGTKISLAGSKVIRAYTVDEVEYRPARIVRNILVWTLIVVGLGTLLLMPVFQDRPEGPAWFLALFHAISAFCNAGFSLFTEGLEAYPQNPSLHLIVPFLIITGGLGFLVLSDLYRWIFRRRALAFHSRVVLLGTAVLLITGVLGFYVLERQGLYEGFPEGGRWMAAWFQSVTTRTAGFNTLPQGGLGEPAQLLTIFFMFIGGAPGSMAGGLKVTTFILLVLILVRQSNHKGRIAFLGRSLDPDHLQNAANLFLKGMVLVVAASFLLSLTEIALAGRDLSYLEILFETVSAFGTVGLSLGITGETSTLGKLLLVLVMFAGRVGMISLVFGLERNPLEKIMEYPKGEVLF